VSLDLHAIVILSGRITCLARPSVTLPVVSRFRSSF